MKQKHLVIFSAVFLLIAFVAGAMLYRGQKSDESLQAYRRDRSTFIRENVPTFGNPAA